MCPSYRVTMEEMHSTRGRARLLWEMLHGSPLTERLAERAGSRIARSLPLVQGMQRRLPGQCRYGQLQGGIPVALLRRATAAAAGVCDGADQRLGAAGLEDAAAGESS